MKLAIGILGQRMANFGFADTGGFEARRLRA